MEALAPLIEQAPNIIREAAKSNLGIFALMILLLGVLAVLFFRQAPVKIRAMIFVLIFAGVSAFGVAILRQIPSDGGAPPVPAPETAPTQPLPDLSGDWQGEGPTDVAEVKKHFQYLHFPPGSMLFRFVLEGGVLGGTLRLRKRYYGPFDREYGLLEGEIDGNRISFAVRSEFAVNGVPKVATERFLGRVDGDRIHFTVQEDTGYPPLHFTAVRRMTDS